MPDNYLLHRSTIPIYHIDLPYQSATLMYHTDLPHWCTTLIYHTDLPHWSTIPIYHTDLPHWSTTLIYHTDLPILIYQHWSTNTGLPALIYHTVHIQVKSYFTGVTLLSKTLSKEWQHPYLVNLLIVVFHPLHPNHPNLLGAVKITFLIKFLKTWESRIVFILTNYIIYKWVAL